MFSRTLNVLCFCSKCKSKKQICKNCCLTCLPFNKSLLRTAFKSTTFLTTQWKENGAWKITCCNSFLLFLLFVGTWSHLQVFSAGFILFWQLCSKNDCSTSGTLSLLFLCFPMNGFFKCFDWCDFLFSLHSSSALEKNQEIEFERNKERFLFLKVTKLVLFWSSQIAIFIRKHWYKHKTLCYLCTLLVMHCWFGSYINTLALTLPLQSFLSVI